MYEYTPTIEKDVPVRGVRTRTLQYNQTGRSYSGQFNVFNINFERLKPNNGSNQVAFL